MALFNFCLAEYSRPVQTNRYFSSIFSLKDQPSGLINFTQSRKEALQSGCEHYPFASHNLYFFFKKKVKLFNLALVIPKGNQLPSEDEDKPFSSVRLSQQAGKWLRGSKVFAVTQQEKSCKAGAVSLKKKKSGMWQHRAILILYVYEDTDLCFVKSCYDRPSYPRGEPRGDFKLKLPDLAGVFGFLAGRGDGTGQPGTRRPRRRELRRARTSSRPARRARVTSYF